MLFLYNFLSYTTGIAAVIFNIILLILKKDKDYLNHLVLLISFIIIIISSTLSFYIHIYDINLINVKFIVWLRYFGVSIIIFTLPNFINNLIKFKNYSYYNVFFSIISAVSGMSTFLIFFKYHELTSVISMTFLLISMLYSLAIIYIFFKKYTACDLFIFLRIISVATLFFIPFMIGFYNFRKYFPFLEKGPIIFPGYFIIWNFVFIIFFLKIFFRPKDKDHELIRNFIKKYSLTKRELEIIDLLVKGLSYKEIQSKLFISMPTVKTHITHIYEKTGMKSKMDLSILYHNETGHN